jgi:hypothetical protein
MPANTTPIFPLTPVYKHAVVTALTTDRTGATTVNLQTLITGATNGTKITQLGVKFQGTTVAGSILIFVTDTSGANLELFDEIQVTAVTANDTTPSFRSVNLYNDFQIASGQLVRVGMTTISSTIAATVFCMAGDY